jgi:hypothetical protein
MVLEVRVYSSSPPVIRLIVFDGKFDFNMEGTPVPEVLCLDVNWNRKNYLII